MFDEEKPQSGIILSDCVDQFMIMSFNDNKAYYQNWLFIAGIAWNEMFKKTFFSAKNVEVKVEEDQGGKFIRKPKDLERVISISMMDDCGKHPLLVDDTVPLDIEYNIPKGKCGKCDSSLRSVIESNITLRTEIFNGKSYTLKTFTEYFENGDVYEVSEKLEYDQPSGEVAKVSTRTKACSLNIYKCGCPKPTAKNKEQLRMCGCDCAGFAICCNPCERKVIENKYGYFNYSLEGDKIRLQAGRYSQFPSMLILAFQSNGKVLQHELTVPSYSLVTMFAGINHFGSQYRGSLSRLEKDAARKNWLYEREELMKFLMPLNPDAFLAIQGILPKWGGGGGGKTYGSGRSILPGSISGTYSNKAESSGSKTIIINKDTCSDEGNLIEDQWD